MRVRECVELLDALFGASRQAYGTAHDVEGHAGPIRIEAAA